ncbi:hypothetical protein ACPPVU_02465 [Mucilaginibacter sp. McL0603]|uniref:hypothetical protein n=1 Tax=Mucilaginibacter sp. McL0603 TaxID=3415670 RepID=UPI003CF4A8E4
MKRKRLLIGFLTVIAMAAILWNALSQPGIADLKGNFKQVAFSRSVQNSGPVIRVYAVTLSDTLWKQMMEYGDYMPHNKYGSTKVYFFLNTGPYPQQVSIGDVNFDSKFNGYCVGFYQKDAMSQVRLKKLPFAK